ncbi:MAG: hypothetical protein ACUVRA_05120 [Candidatus Bathyarchaeaceae archaeon]
MLILIVAVASITVTTIISILLSKINNLYVPSLGTIKTIGVEAYWDSKCENKTETIEGYDLAGINEKCVILPTKCQQLRSNFKPLHNKLEPR